MYNKNNLNIVAGPSKGDKMWRANLGKFGEDFVAQKLEESGWLVMERNWRAGKYGEVDMICQDPDDILVFIEVKTRVVRAQRSGFQNAGFESITSRKIRNMTRAAMFFMASGNISKSCRFDVITVACSEHAINLSPKMTHAKDAFAPT